MAALAWNYYCYCRCNIAVAAAVAIHIAVAVVVVVDMVRIAGDNCCWCWCSPSSYSVGPSCLARPESYARWAPRTWTVVVVENSVVVVGVAVAVAAASFRGARLSLADANNDSGIVRSEYRRLRLAGDGSVRMDLVPTSAAFVEDDPVHPWCWGRSCETEYDESLSSIDNAGKENRRKPFALERVVFRTARSELPLGC